MNFKNLHQQEAPLLICNVWDAASAKVAQKLNFKVIGTSSAAIASMLGYEDGEQMSFGELVFIVKRILAVTTLPLTVDIEAGFSRDPIEVASHIKELVELGVVGINIEDSLCINERTLQNADEFAKKLSEIKQILNKEKVNVFINVRTDTFLLGKDNALADTLARIKLYASTGIDGIFVPCITKESDISTVVESTSLPINVMCMPDLPDFKTLEKLNIKRISMGNFMFDNLALNFENTLYSISESQSFTPVF
ncbi:isocitrate lyase/PEP mutase family protein [Pseudoalteromonas denitrificans]|uniref:2-Methylisocitrate lyase, PEP mutase family n=1 Tax=Pseudoalteromonas denitrificans DSM 6059 TaxID=1123010 RepID=A0A1I1SC59_9GAMM|nr:isocitrate lyase/phosphoenolpyruvate mutase family protein [Pseudoalteromonas denitrificans]SFD42188.1 2-Methylisocitrate lyase, PEP mutase family [Pseudoalteromonas denitrificans DSM 6059]